MSWVQDFNSVQASSVSAPGGSSVSIPKGKIAKRKETAADKLKAELKLLEWHKLANDAAIKAALMQTKQLKEEKPQSPSYIGDDASWIRRVINNEQTKPLEVSRDYVVQHEKAEKIAQERIEHQTNHHLDVIKSMREKLEDKAALRSRTQEFRDWKKEFSGKKLAVMSGKTLEDYSRESTMNGGDSSAAGSGSIAGAGESVSGRSARANKASELSTVLKSLDKLNELEQRISSLEGDNAHSRMLEAEAPSHAGRNERLALEFRKKVKGDGTVNRAVYAVRERQASWKGNSGNRAGARGTGVSAVRSSRNGGGGGTFLTDLGEETGGGPQSIRDQQRMARLREQSQQPAGKKNLRVRVQTKKIRTKESNLSKKRHEEALAELKRRKADSIKKVHGARNSRLPPVQAKKGASAGVKTNNKYLADFQKMKQSNARKREPVAAPQRSRTSAPPAAARGNATGAQGRSGVTRKSKTVPVRPVRNSAAQRGNQRGNELGGGLPPLGAVGNGFNGVRAMKNNENSKW